MKQVLMSAAEMKVALEQISEKIVEDDWKGLALVGIQTKGVILAKRLQHLLEQKTHITFPLGSVDTSLYRDVFGGTEVERKILGSTFDFALDESNILLVDDVIQTGRTVRAAIENIIDKGRPKLIRLFTLIDRDGRELPIKPDYIGKKVIALDNEYIKVYLEEVDEQDKVVILKEDIGWSH